MKINTIKYWAIAALFGMGMASCEDFLDRPVEDNYNESNFYQNDEQCIQGVNYLYNSPWYDFQRAFINIGEVMSGNMYSGSSPYLEFTVNGTDGDLINMSYSLWAAIGHANTVYTRLKTANASAAVKNQTMGECLVWKAMAYFYLVRTFGDVPIIHDNNAELTSGTYNQKYKVKKANIYEYIIMTLEKAIELLPEKNAAGRIDQYSAKGLLAKVYLTRSGVSGSRNADDLAEAAKYAKDVIDNSGRELVPVYSDIFRGSNNFSDESLIAWHWSASRDPWTQQNTLQSDLAMQGFSNQGDCWGGWRGPSVDLQDDFGVSALDNPQNRPGDKDTRRQATMMLAGDVYDYFWRDKGGFDLLKFVYDAEGYGKGGPGGSFQSGTGAQNVKHLYGNDADHYAELGVYPGNMCYGFSTHLLRLADVYLVYAEAKMGTATSTSDQSALDAYNAVRARAIPGVTPATSITWEDVWKERRLELAGEGDRWYDYVRRSYYDMNGAINELKNQRRDVYWGIDELYKTYYETGNWVVDETITRYNPDAVIPNVTASSFTLPFPTEDVVFNPHLMEDPIEVDVRAEYAY